MRVIGLIWLRIGIIREPLWMRHWTSGFHKSWSWIYIHKTNPKCYQNGTKNLYQCIDVNNIAKSHWFLELLCQMIYFSNDPFEEKFQFQEITFFFCKNLSHDLIERLTFVVDVVLPLFQSMLPNAFPIWLLSLVTSSNNKNKNIMNVLVFLWFKLC